MYIEQTVKRDTKLLCHIIGLFRFKQNKAYLWCLINRRETCKQKLNSRFMWHSTAILGKSYFLI